jgi:multidrug efflux system membrane fusion protein
MDSSVNHNDKTSCVGNKAFELGKGETLPADSHEHHIGPDHQLPGPASDKSQSKIVRIVVWVVLLLIFAAGFYWILNRHSDTKDTKKGGGGRRGANAGPVTLYTATAQKGDLGVYLDAIGTVTPVYTSSITSQVSGVITAVHYKEGQMVHKGDPLVEIDSRPYRATLLQAQGILERDQNVLAQAQMDLDRYKAAWARNAIPKQTLDDQEKVVLQNEGTVKNDEGTVQFDQIQVDYCHITAPFTGRVGLRLVDPGNVVQSSGTVTLAVITQLQPITVIFTLPEDNLGQIQPRLRQNAKLPVLAFDRAALKQIASGNLITLDNQIDTTTGTVKARALFDNKDSMLFPNEFVNTRLLVNTLHNTTLIPTSTIQHNGKTSFVYVLQDNVAHMRTVKPGVADGSTTSVEGVQPGDVLANGSFEKLQDKSRIIISKTPMPVTSGSEAP